MAEPKYIVDADNKETKLESGVVQNKTKDLDNLADQASRSEQRSPNEPNNPIPYPADKKD